MSTAEKDEHILKTSTSFLTKLIAFDMTTSEKIHNLEIDDNTDIFLYLIEKIYRPICIIIYLFILLGYYSYKENALLIWRPLVHVIVIHILSRILQSYIARPKPKWKETIERGYKIACIDLQYSMPNGEVMQASNFAIFLICYLNNFCGVFIIPLVMIAKIIYSYNYISDTLAGAILGSIISLVLCFCFK